MARLDKESKRVSELLENIEKFLQLCKTEHEMYFMGILKRPPDEKAAELVRLFSELEHTTILNTALSFRSKVVRTRWNSLKLLWLRTNKQIEEGTYRRQRVMADLRDKDRAANKKVKADPEVVRAELRALARGMDPKAAIEEAQRLIAARRPATATAATADKPGAPPSSAGMPSVPSPAATPEPTPNPALRPTVTRPTPAQDAPGASSTNRQSSVSGHSLGSDSLYQEYLAARTQAGEVGRGLSSEALRQVLAKQKDAIKGQYGVADVRFRVVVEGGKSKVKAIPVK